MAQNDPESLKAGTPYSKQVAMFQKNATMTQAQQDADGMHAAYNIFQGKTAKESKQHRIKNDIYLPQPAVQKHKRNYAN